MPPTRPAAYTIPTQRGPMLAALGNTGQTTWLEPQFIAAYLGGPQQFEPHPRNPAEFTLRDHKGRFTIRAEHHPNAPQPWHVALHTDTTCLATVALSSSATNAPPLYQLQQLAPTILQEFAAQLLPLFGATVKIY
jgi:hypothetical protein